MSEQAHYDAIKALLETADATPLSLADIKRREQKNDLPAAYTELYLSERFTSPVLVGGRSTLRAWRVQTRAVATTEENARVMRERARSALEEQVIDVGGVTATIFRAVSDDPIGEDNGRYSGLSEYGYTL